MLSVLKINSCSLITFQLSSKVPQYCITTYSNSKLLIIIYPSLLEPTYIIDRGLYNKYNILHFL